VNNDINFEEISYIENGDQLADFVNALRENLLQHSDEWENLDLERFLTAMEAWIRSLNSYARNSGDSSVMVPTWSTFAKILCAAKVYE